MTESKARLVMVVSGGEKFYFFEDDIIAFDGDSPEKSKTLKVSKAFITNIYMLPVATPAGIVPQIGTTVDEVHDVEIVYSVYGYVPERSPVMKAVKEHITGIIGG